MSVLVTGVRGFIGHALAERLRGSGRVTLTHRVAGPGVAGCDLLDAAATRRIVRKTRPRVVYHLAGSTKALPWEGLWDAHVRATIHLLDACAELARPVTVVLCGSAAEYGSGGLPGPVTESAPREPLSVYGSTKLSQSVAAFSYAARGVDVREALVFNAIGPGIPERLALGAFARQLADIRHGRRAPLIETGDLRPKRDFVDVRDTADALIAVARRGAPGETYNVCSGRAVSIGWMLDRLIAMTGLDVEVRREKSRKAPGVPVIFGSHAKLTRATGWRPRVPLESCLRDTLAWYDALS